MASLSGADVSFTVLGDLIEKDTVVAGNLLRIVNSAAYSRRETINSVRHALSVLGVEKVRNAVLGMSVSRMLNQATTPAGWSMERFNKHSAAAAILSDMIAQRVRTEYPEGAFIGGLLHDVGRLLIAMGLPNEFQAILAMNRAGVSWLECEEKVLGFTHPILSQSILAAWKLPEEVCVAVAQHHDPVRTTSPMSLGAVLSVANQYLNAVGESIVPGPTNEDQAVTILESLTISKGVAKLVADFRTEHGAIAQFYQ
jgi:HD-like signal output (HDOD) protein